MKLETRVKNRAVVSMTVRYKMFKLDNLEKDIRDKVLRMRANARDLSRGGMQVVSEDPLKAGDILEIAMRIPGEGQTRTLAKVVWNRPATADGKRVFRSGIRFIPVDEKELRRVEEYLASVQTP
jgi:Tfp pilus assembly protein PilZ